MKNINQTSASQMKAELIQSMKLLLSRELNPLLLDALKSVFPSVSIAFVLNWIPEQAEDIYWLLVDGNRILIAEIPRSNVKSISDISVEEIPLVEFEARPLSLVSRRKLRAAVELTRELRN